MTMAVDAPFDLRYQPHTSNTGPGKNAGLGKKDAEREIEEDDFATAFYENDQIDLGQLMREQLYLAVPMKPLCDDACRGLCPVCGTNLNRGACDVPARLGRPAFGAAQRAAGSKTTTND